MSSSPTTHQALWLDPLRPLTEAQQAQLALSGLMARPVRTLDELQETLPQADCLVVRLADNLDLLQELLTLVKKLGHEIPVICRVDRRSLEVAVGAMRTGAQHVLDADEWSTAAWQSAMTSQSSLPLEKPAPKRAAAPRSVVYVDPASRNLLALAQRVAKANVTVLIEGPTGSGKEVLARVLHESSDCARGPFVGLNCAAMPEQMIEDMLFGHEKGAFTGAMKEHKGLFEQAQGGTLFLDEIAEMPIHLQAKLLRVLQERMLVRLGGERVTDLNVRVIAATNQNLREAIGRREFREDLYFRISTFKLCVPTLAQRPGDILPLTAKLLARPAPNGQAYTVTPQAQALLLAYAWPGNVRELENVIQRALVICADHVITPEHLMFDDRGPYFLPDTTSAPALNAAPVPAPAASPASDYTLPLTDASPGRVLHAAVRESEHQTILAAIDTTQSRLEAAKMLGISPRTLRYKLAKLRGDVPASLALTS